MFKIEADVASLVDSFNNIAASQIPFATANAATLTAKDIRAAEQDEMKAVFDRPTPFSLNAFQVIPATKQDPVAEVSQKFAMGTSAPRHWFDPQVEGGPRRPKGFELLLRARGIIGPDDFAVPAKGCPLDAYGNIPGSLITAILSDLQAQRDFAQNATPKSRKRNKKARYVLIGGSPAPWGVARNDGPWSKFIIVFVHQPKYRKRFDFFGVAQKAFDANFAGHFEVTLARAIATAR